MESLASFYSIGKFCEFVIMKDLDLGVMESLAKIGVMVNGPT